MTNVHRLPGLSRLAAALVFAAALGAAAQSPAPRPEPRLASPPSRIVPVDRIVAVVNDEVITHNELNERVSLISGQLGRQGGQLPPAEVLSRQILERMINDLVQAQVAKETGIRIDDVTLDRTIERIAQENRLSMADFRTALERDGVKFARFREDIRNEIIVARLREREVENTLVVTDAEVETELAREAKEKSGDSEFRLAHILVTVPAAASPEQIDSRRRRALQALSELRRGTGFPQVAASFSDAPDALQGGNLGWRAAARLPVLFLEAIEKIKPGEVTDILRSPNGFHIVKLLEKRERAAPAGVQQSRARHILVRTREGLPDAEARARLERLRARVGAGEDFGELAKVHSEDATASKGGDLGWLAAGDTVPEFERVLNAVAVGAVSEPFQTPFGWHLVQVLERRSDEQSEERRRNAARQAIRARKGDEAYADWLRVARDRAFVENRLDER
jgi:peptidyl-prolyl cis-trans isomerase SurA